MKIVISPAKSLDFESALPTADFTQPVFEKEMKTVHSVLKKKKAKGIN